MAQEMQGNKLIQFYQRKTQILFIALLMMIKKFRIKIIDNKKVVGLKEFKSIAFNKIVSNVIISIPSIKPEILEKKIKMLKSLNLNVNYLPFKENLISDKISLDDVRYSQLTNLLDKDFLKNQKISFLIN